MEVPPYAQVKTDSFEKMVCASLVEGERHSFCLSSQLTAVQTLRRRNMYILIWNFGRTWGNFFVENRCFLHGFQESGLDVFAVMS